MHKAAATAERTPGAAPAARAAATASAGSAKQRDEEIAFVEGAARQQRQREQRGAERGRAQLVEQPGASEDVAVTTAEAAHAAKPQAAIMNSAWTPSARASAAGGR